MSATVGERLDEAMKAKGISARKLAAVLGVNRTTIGDYISGKHSPTVAWLDAAAGQLAVRTAYLVTGTGAMWRDTGEAGSVGERLSALAPNCIPDSERERFGWFAGSVAGERHLNGGAAERTALRLLTAVIAEQRRGRGEPKMSPEEMLEKLYEWRGARGLQEFVLFSLLAARLVVPGRYVPPAPAPRAAPPKRRGPRHK